MRLLLDTHVFLWILTDSRELSLSVRETIGAADAVYVSSVSIWEIAIKIQLGKLKGNLAEIIGALKKSGFIELSLLNTHSLMLSQLPDLHRDPFDRMLIAQAMSEPLILMTRDQNLAAYSHLVSVI